MSKVHTFPTIAELLPGFRLPLQYIGTGEPPALRSAYREASATGTVATTDGLVISTTAVTQHLPAVADMLDTGETYREVLFQAGGGAITVDVPSSDTLYGLDGALLSSVLIPVGQSARFGTFTSGTPDSWVLLSHSGRMADLYNVGLGIACADYTTFINDYSALVATTLAGGAVGVPILVLYDDDTLDRFVTTGSSCASRMTLTASAHSGQTVGAAVLLALPAFTTTLRWERMIGTDDGGSTYTVGVASVGALTVSDIDGLLAALDTKQNVDADITALAALTTTAFGRSLLELADAAALQATVGGYVTLADTTLGSANAALTASWIGDYPDLRISVIGRTSSTGVATATVTCQFNGDTGSNYYNSGGSAGTSITLGVLSGSQTNTNRVGRVDAEIANQLAHHTLLGRYNAPSSSANSFSTGTTSGKWANAARINSIQLAMGAVNFDAGCRLIVEGRA